MNEGLIVLVRGIIAFFSLLIFTRSLGKQQVSQLTLFEYVLGITIGSTASTLTTDLSSAAWPHWVGLAIWTILVYIVQKISVKFPKVSEYINGVPQVIIINGKILEDNIKRMRYSLYDLLEQLRSKDVFDISQVAFAVLETNGQLSVLKKSQFQNLTPKDMNIKTGKDGLSTELIFNGVILEHNLNRAKLDKNWLLKQLRQRKIRDPKEVYLATINVSKELYVDLYKDHITNSMDIVDK